MLLDFQTTMMLGAVALATILSVITKERGVRESYHALFLQTIPKISPFIIYLT